MLNFCDFIQVYVFSTNHHLNRYLFITFVSRLTKSNIHVWETNSYKVFEEDSMFCNIITALIKSACRIIRKFCHL